MMAQYNAETFSEADLGELVQLVEDYVPKTTPSNILSCQPFAAGFLSFYEDLLTGNGDGAGGGSFVWAG